MNAALMSANGAEEAARNAARAAEERRRAKARREEEQAEAQRAQAAMNSARAVMERRRAEEEARAAEERRRAEARREADFSDSSKSDYYSDSESEDEVDWRRVERAAQGMTYSRGGLNMDDIIDILEANGLPADGRRAEIQARLITLLPENDYSDHSDSESEDNSSGGECYPE
jgi:hypothetical protein